LKPVAVVVLGDLARCPRMLNHARMLAKHGWPVELLGYSDRPLSLPDSVRCHALHPMRRAPEGSSTLVFATLSLLRMSALCLELMFRLIRLRPGVILAQNPPSFPTLIATWTAARLSGARLVVDWHNYGYSILALRLQPNHTLVRLARWHEQRCAAWADAHFCVSDAMRAELATLGIHASVLYDRPHEILPAPANVPSNSIICPTGWTTDEDIPLLLSALAILDAEPETALDVYLTGDGPLREPTQTELARHPLQRIHVHIDYFPAEKYQELLRNADLGVSMHRSSSGVDLAMKVVDMFEARLPVCALDTGRSLPEQVRDGATGIFFRTAQELADAIAALLSDDARRSAMRAQIEIDWQETWAQHWERIAAPVLKVRTA
jgi:beta-1,4-mannosyltransferase